MMCRTCGYDIPDAGFFADYGGYYDADAGDDLVHRESGMTPEMLRLHQPSINAAMREWDEFRRSLKSPVRVSHDLP